MPPGSTLCVKPTRKEMDAFLWALLKKHTKAEGKGWLVAVIMGAIMIVGGTVALGALVVYGLLTSTIVGIEYDMEIWITVAVVLFGFLYLLLPFYILVSETLWAVADGDVDNL